MAEFLAMGGYGAYVWSAYGLAALVLGGIALTSRGAERAARRVLLEDDAGEDHADDPAT